MPRVALLIVILTLPAPVLPAQWRVGVTAAALRFGAVAEDTVSGSRWASLTSPVVVVARIEREIGHVRIGLDVASGGAGLTIEDHAFALVAKHAFHLWEVAPGVGVRVAGPGAGASAWLEAGPVLDIWVAEGAGTRVRGGVHGSVSFAYSLSARVSGTLGVQGSITPSPFDRTDLTPGFERRAAKRRAILAGIRYRL